MFDLILVPVEVSLWMEAATLSAIVSAFSFFIGQSSSFAAIVIQIPVLLLFTRIHKVVTFKVSFESKTLTQNGLPPVHLDGPLSETNSQP